MALTDDQPTPSWLAEQNLSADEWKRAYFALAEIAQPRVARLTDALRQIGISEAVIGDVADGRTDIHGRVPDGLVCTACGAMMPVQAHDSPSWHDGP